MVWRHGFQYKQKKTASLTLAASVKPIRGIILTET
jgi:hypothetical protein